ncbi:MAG: acyl-CoA dehydrogenase family protein, partial [Acidimicrobiales bacterium]
ADLINAEVLPREKLLWGAVDSSGRREDGREDSRQQASILREQIKAKVRDAGLWAPHLPTEYGGMGLDFLQLAYMYEVLAYAAGAAALFGVAAPNSGNARILVKYGTEAQKRKWLLPLVDGEMESGFSMTEPDTAGSNPRSLASEAVRDGDEWVINGHKWFTSNGFAADFFIVMCRANDPTGELGKPGQMTQVIVPSDATGVTIVRGIGIFGHSTTDHCEIIYDNVRVPVENTLGLVGQGHQAAQDRLGAGRVYHCMNSIGQMWRAFDLMVERALVREVHGGLLKDKQFIQGFIADSYIDVQSARLMTIAAAKMVADGDPQARTAISAIKVYVPAAYHRVVDRAIQVWGGAGVSNDLPLGRMYLAARVLRLADGPDEVHRILMAKNIIHEFETGSTWDFGS